ncbi:hypothetical protein MJL79_31105, partial [Salmonella enterica subsp. enterica serovar Montevideo]|nr:hypothetical protein [Salmonella enterica subsp. enterica serovar Montevideo]
RNSVRLERLKDKLGNRSNASAEVEFQDAVGWRLGEEGEGIRHDEIQSTETLIVLQNPIMRTIKP